MIAQNVWQALGRPGFLCSGWLLRSVGYLTVSGLTGLLTLVVALLLLSVGGLLAVVVVGIPLLGAIALLGLPVAGIERWSLRMIDARPVPDAHRTPPRPGLASWLRTRFTEPVTWRELGYAALLMLVLWPIDLLAVILGLTVPLALLATPLLLATVSEGSRSTCSRRTRSPPGRLPSPPAPRGSSLWLPARTGWVCWLVPVVRWPDSSSPRRSVRWATGSPSSPAPGSAWSTRLRPSAGASSGTCTTVHSNASWRSR
ncbi:sensor domain-containing protein [Micromonospora saelicesensis]|uniref:sensor domain-containing protein n=1 Tax=Micromonospora saelicesensis TaxID=285676 RepID=UPI0021AC6C46|nr:sensor domain-containing protein [Micromonospora saelicesensis]